MTTFTLYFTPYFRTQKKRWYIFLFSSLLGLSEMFVHVKWAALTIVRVYTTSTTYHYSERGNTTSVLGHIVWSDPSMLMSWKDWRFFFPSLFSFDACLENRKWIRADGYMWYSHILLKNLHPKRDLRVFFVSERISPCVSETLAWAIEEWEEKTWNFREMLNSYIIWLIYTRPEDTNAWLILSKCHINQGSH